jgi:hypothetical protein
MEAIKFFDFKNRNFNGMVVVAAKYSGHIESFLSSYYGEATEVASCAKSAHDMELFTSYSDVNLDERLAIFEVDSDGISSGRQPKICYL